MSFKIHKLPFQPTSHLCCTIRNNFFSLQTNLRTQRELAEFYSSDKWNFYTIMHELCSSLKRAKCFQRRRVGEGWIHVIRIIIFQKLKILSFQACSFQACSFQELCWTLQNLYSIWRASLRVRLFHSWSWKRNSFTAFKCYQMTVE